MAARKRKRTATPTGKKQGLDKRHFNYGRWTKGRFSEAVTVTGPAKMVFLAGIGSEHEQTGKIMYPAILPRNAATPIASSRKYWHATAPAWPMSSSK